MLKRWISLALSLLLLSLAACGSTAPEQAAAPTEAEDKQS